MILKAKSWEQIKVVQFILIGWRSKNPKSILPFLARIRPKTLTRDGQNIDFLI